MYSLRLLFIFPLLLVCVCCADSATGRIFRDAESLMAERPDSSLMLLRSVDTAALRSDADRALYGLLLTQAQFKNYMPPADDSLIDASRLYYEGRDDDARHRMLAEYYYGRMRVNDSDYTKGLFSFLNSYDLAVAADDKFWAGMNAGQICEIYRMTYNYDEMQKFAEIEYDNFLSFGKPVYIHDALFDLAMSHHCNEDYDTAIALCRQLADTAKKYEDELFGGDVARQIALSYYAMGQHDSAAYYYKQLTMSPAGLTSDSAYLGVVLLKQGKLSEAKLFMPNSYSENEMISSHLRYDLYLAMDSVKEALATSQEIVENINGILKETIDRNLAGAFFDYNKYKIANERIKRKQTQIVLFFVCCLAVVIITGMVYEGNRYIRRQRLLIDRNVEVAENLRDMMMVNDKRSNALILSMMGDRFEILDKLCQLLYSAPNSAQAKKKISHEIELLIDQYSKDEKKIAELESYADTHYDNIMTSFREDFPNLINNDYLLFLYSIYGFSSPAIALFLGLENVSGVYDRRKRLKNKIKVFEGENKTKYLQILSK